MGAYDNSLVLIRSSVGGHAVASIVKEGLLSCDHFRGFWISWSGGIIRVGEGRTPYENELIRTENVTVPFSSIAIATEFEVTGTWEITTSNTIPPGKNY